MAADIDFTFANVNYDRSTKTATIPFSTATELTEILQTLTCNFRVHPLAPVHVRALVDAVTFLVESVPSESNDAAEEKVDGLEATLHPHQQVALRRVLSRKRILLALDMGLGKTITSIASMLKTSARHVLVIAPASLRFNWRNELTKFISADKITVNVIKSTEHAEATFGGNVVADDSDKDAGALTVTVVSFSLISRIKRLLAAQQFDIVVLDEAHYVKNRSSQRSKSAKKIIDKAADRLVLLTGTPAQRHENYWNLLRLLDCVVFKHFHNSKPIHSLNVAPRLPSTEHFYFADRYCVPEPVRIRGNSYTYTFSRNTRAEELRLITAPYTLRQTKDLLDLPPLLTSSVIIGAATAAQARKFLKRLTAVQTLRETAGTSAANAVLSELVRETSRVKLPHVLNYLTHLAASLDHATKTIIWVKHQFVGNAISELLHDKLKLKYIHIDGTIAHKHREKLLSMFATDPDVRFAVFGIQACGTGINVTCANLNIYAEMVFNSIDVAQSESRSHRLGQKKTVVLRRLIMEGTTDTLVEASVKRKRDAEARVLGDDLVGDLPNTRGKKYRRIAQVEQVDI